MSLPVHHVDVLRWVSPTERRSPDEVRALAEEAAAGPGWVAEGSVGPTVNVFASAADSVVFLDYARRVTMLRLVKRWSQRQRVGMPVSHVERPSVFAVRFNWTWKREHREALVADLEAAGGPIVRLSIPPRDVVGAVEAGGRRWSHTADPPQVE